MSCSAREGLRAWFRASKTSFISLFSYPTDRSKTVPLLRSFFLCASVKGVCGVLICSSLILCLGGLCFVTFPGHFQLYFDVFIRLYPKEHNKDFSR